MFCENQKEKFETDPILIQLSQPSQIRFTGCLHGPDNEKRLKLVQCCKERKLPVATVSMGINLELILSTINSETNEIVFESELIFNGVFVKCKGKINKQTLFGTIFLEFDAEKAESETQKNSEALKMYKTRIDAIQNYLSS